MIVSRNASMAERIDISEMLAGFDETAQAMKLCVNGTAIAVLLHEDFLAEFSSNEEIEFQGKTLHRIAGASCSSIKVARYSGNTFGLTASCASRVVPWRWFGIRNDSWVAELQAARDHLATRRDIVSISSI